MHWGDRFAIWLAVAAIVCLLPAAVLAAPRVWTPTGEHVGVDHRRAARVIALGRDHAERFGLGGLRGLSLEASARPTIASSDLEVWRLEASLAGVPLSRPVARALVDVSEGGRVLLWTHGDPVGPLVSDRPGLDDASALARLDASGLSGRSGAAAAELVVVAGWPHSRLAWQIEPPPDVRARTHRVFWVDAVTGEVIAAREKLRFSDVRAFGINPVATPQAEVFALNEIDAMPAFLDGPRFRARNCLMPNDGDGDCVATQVATPDMNGDFLYPAPMIGDPDVEPASGEPFSETSAYFHADRLFAWLDTLGFPGLVCHEMALPAVLTVNYASWGGGVLQPFDNAFYTGSCSDTVYMGQGGRDTAWDGDIVYHELGHGVVDRQTFGGLGEERRRPDGVTDDAGAINEGFSDYLSAVFSDDPIGFEYGLPGYSRNADNDMWCARDLVGELHADGELFSGAMWEIHQELGEPFMAAVIDALAMVDVDVSFEEISAAVLATTSAELGEDARDQAAAILDARGMVDCPRHADVTEFGAGGAHNPLPARTLILWPPEWFYTYAPVRPGPFEFFVEFPEGMDTVELRYDVLLAFTTEPAVGADLGVIFKADTPITFSYEEENFGEYSVSADSTGFIDHAENGFFELKASPGEVVYFSFVHMGGPAPGDFADPAVNISDLQVEFSGPPAPEETGDETDSGDGTTDTDAGNETESETGDEPGADTEPGGCGCRSAGNGTGWGWLGLAGFGLLRRRRTRIR